jgi:hypothetical protein
VATGDEQPLTERPGPIGLHLLDRSSWRRHSASQPRRLRRANARQGGKSCWNRSGPFRWPDVLDRLFWQRHSAR